MNALMETVFCNKQKIREAFRVSFDEASAAIQTVTEHFPDYVDYITNHSNPMLENVIARVEGYREPYQGEHISLYCFNEVPQELLTEFNVTDDLWWRPWYGLKFIIDTQQVFLKLPFDDGPNGMPRPDFGQDVVHFANIYSHDGFTGQRDAYLLWELSAMHPNTEEEYFYSVPCANFCDKHELPHPAPKFVNPFVSMWAIAYDAETLVPSTAKAYTFFSKEGEGQKYG